DVRFIRRLHEYGRRVGRRWDDVGQRHERQTAAETHNHHRAEQNTCHGASGDETALRKAGNDTDSAWLCQEPVQPTFSKPAWRFRARAGAPLVVARSGVRETAKRAPEPVSQDEFHFCMACPKIRSPSFPAARSWLKTLRTLPASASAFRQR